VPAVSVPCHAVATASTAARGGLPVGVQVLSASGADLRALEVAAAIEAAGRQRPR
jgi:Asp-tRNA(Asn)/Glu-tRNA(Gln) amidotransferase A subunit family amidase